MEFMPDLLEISTVLATIFKKVHLCDICCLKFNLQNYQFSGRKILSNMWTISNHQITPPPFISAMTTILYSQKLKLLTKEFSYNHDRMVVCGEYCLV